MCCEFRDYSFMTQTFFESQQHPLTPQNFHHHRKRIALSNGIAYQFRLSLIWVTFVYLLIFKEIDKFFLIRILINLRNDIGTGKHQFQNIPSKKLNIY